MCGPGFVARAAERADLAGIGRVAAETGVGLPDAATFLDLARAGRGQLDVAVSGGEVVGFCATGEVGEGGIATVVGPTASAAGAGLGVEKRLLARAAEGAAARGVRALRVHAAVSDPVRASLLTGQGFARTPQTGSAGEVAFTKTL